MDFGLLLFVAAFMIYTEMKSRQKKRRMQRRKENSPPKPQKRVIIKRKAPQTSSQKTKSEKAEDDAFDFEGFRKKFISLGARMTSLRRPKNLILKSICP